MPNEVSISVRSKLLKIIEDLDQIEKKGEQVNESLKTAGKTVGDTIGEQAKKTETFMESLTRMGRRAADQLKGDFKALLSVNAITESLKISEQFKGSVREALQLNDVIRKLGSSFGIAGKDYARFQSQVLKGLGQLGSEAGANALQGLAGTGVKGASNVVSYAQSAGQLASLSGQKGREGDIAKGLAETVRARGMDVNSSSGMKEMANVAEDLRRAFNQTGKSPTELLSSMRDLFAGMSQDFRKSISSRGMVGLAAAGQAGGPNSTKFLEEFLSKSPIARKAIEAQGGKGIVNNQGVDVDKFRTFSKAILARVGGDPRLAAQTLGLSEDAAEGFIRLSESLDRVKEAQDAIAKSTGSVEEQYKNSMGAGEAFKASINRVKSMIAGPLSTATQGVTDALSGASGSNAGAMATVLGGGALAATLAGYGLKAAGKAAGIGGIGGLAKGAAIEATTGRQVTPVYVVNASEISEAKTSAVAAASPLLGKAASAMKAVGAVGAAGGIGYEIGSDINEHLIEKTQGTTSEGFQGNIVEQMFFKIDKLLDKMGAGTGTTKTVIELNKRDLKESKQPTRGASQ